MSSLDDFHGGEDCFCNPTIEQVFANDGVFRNLIIHNKVDLHLVTVDGEQIVAESGMTLEDSIELTRFLENEMQNVDLQLAKWWAVIEYAKLGA